MPALAPVLRPEDPSEDPSEPSAGGEDDGPVAVGPAVPLMPLVVRLVELLLVVVVAEGAGWVGTWPAAQPMLWPVCKGRDAMLARLPKSVKAGVAAVLLQVHPVSPCRSVDGEPCCEQADHW